MYLKVFIAALVVFSFASNRAKAQLTHGHHHEKEFQVIRIGGSSTLKKLVDDISKKYLSTTSRVEIEHTETSSGKGIQALLQGAIDIAKSSRPLSIKERDKASEQSKVLVQFPIAHDAMIVTGSKKACTISKIDINDLARFFTNCGADDGSDFANSKLTKKSPYLMDYRSSGTAKVIRNYFETYSRDCKFDSWNKRTKEIRKTTLILDEIIADPSGISFISHSLIDESFKIYPVQINNQTFIPNKSTIVNKHYPFSRKVYLVVEYPIKESVVDFLRFVTSDATAKTISSNGFFPLRRN